MITLLWCRGIGESIGGGMLSGVEGHLNDNVRTIEVPWPAQYGPVGQGGFDGMSYEEALGEGRRQILKAIADDPYPVILAGYSGGAALVGNVAQEIGQGDHPNLEVWGVGFVADPNQPEGVAHNEMFGVAGSRRISGMKTHWEYDLRDPIPCTPALSPLRTLADQSYAMSLADPVAWGQDLVNRMVRGRWQPSAWNWRDIIGSIRRYSRAAGRAAFYLNGGHYRSYVPGSQIRLANWINITAGDY